MDGSALFQIYQAFASDAETQSLRQAYADGIGWADAKQLVFERLDREITPMRERYENLLRDPASIEDILLAGAAKARKIATPFMARLRHAVGLRDLRAPAGKGSSASGKAAKVALPVFKQYREKDGQFYFKLADAQGRVLLQSAGFTSPKDAGAVIARLQSEGAAAIDSLAAQVQLAAGAAKGDVGTAMEQLAAAAAA